jgi:hypothetical protein
MQRQALFVDLLERSAPGSPLTPLQVMLLAEIKDPVVREGFLNTNG